MTALVDVCPQAAIQITRAAPLFDRLAGAVVEHRASLATHQCAGGLVGTGSERDLLRERLDWFFPKFRDLYFNLLRQHVGSDLPEVLAALSDETIQQYLRALEAMQPALLHCLEQLGQEMVSALESS
ncbi:MAG: hypothetical protein ABI895_35520 [Deltaproteobacteria bacterium]